MNSNGSLSPIWAFLDSYAKNKYVTIDQIEIYNYNVIYNCLLSDWKMCYCRILYESRMATYQLFRFYGQVLLIDINRSWLIWLEGNVRDFRTRLTRRKIPFGKYIVGQRIRVKGWVMHIMYLGTQNSKSIVNYR